jgi:histone deacetylase 1/2
MKKRDTIVSYFYDEEVGNYCLGGNQPNPMRPHRARMTHSLLTGYNMDQKLVVNRPTPRSFDQLTSFHADGALAAVAVVRADGC